MKLLKDVTRHVSQEQLQQALVFLRITIGLLTIPHGYPKLMGGELKWYELGVTFMQPLGIDFLPTMWGFLGGAIEFFGGIALVLGFGTRIAGAFLSAMMAVATVWHVVQGDPFMDYSFPLSLLMVFIFFTVVGSGSYSLDDHIIGRKPRRIRRKKA